MTSHRRGRHRRRITLSLVVGALTATVAGAAFAFWISSGTGAAAAGSASAAAVTLTPGTAAAQLYPGGQAAVTLTIANPGAATVRIGSLVLDSTQGSSGFAVDAAHAGCTLSALAFTTQTNTGAGWTVPGGGSLPVTLPGSLAMATSAANACQGATFTVHLKAAS